MKRMVQCGDLLADQKLFYAEACMNGCIVMVQDSSFACSQGPWYLTNFIHKASQDFLMKVLIICLSFRYKLLMHQALVAKKK